MNEKEREIVKKFERLYLKDFNNEKITNEDRLSYIECILMSNLIEKLQKENEELKEINNELEAEKNEAIRRYNFESIPVSLVEEKIEELKEEVEQLRIERNVTYDSGIYRNQIKIDILQELLEKRKYKMCEFKKGDKIILINTDNHPEFEELFTFTIKEEKTIHNIVNFKK